MTGIVNPGSLAGRGVTVLRSIKVKTIVISAVLVLILTLQQPVFHNSFSLATRRDQLTALFRPS